MNFPTNLLSIFAKHAGDQSPADGRLAVPNILQPIVQIPEVLAATDNVIANDNTIKLSSFIRSVTISTTNAAGSTINMATIGPGLWSLEFYIYATVNFTAIATQASISCQLLSGSTQSQLFIWPGQSGDVSFLPLTLNFAHADPLGLQFVVGTITNGVGQTTIIQVFLNAKRLG